MPKNATTDIVNDPLYQRKYYAKNKEIWQRTQRKNYCKRVYNIWFTEDEINQMGEDYKLVARYLRDSKTVLDKYKDLVEKYKNVSEL